MKDFVKRMIEEHAQLSVRITKLHNYIYDGRGEQDEPHELANKCMQLVAMKQYATALECRLNNQNIVVKDGEYLETVAKIVSSNEQEETDVRIATCTNNCECDSECEENKD